MVNVVVLGGQIKADGHCLFRAISKQLKLRCGRDVREWWW